MIDAVMISHESLLAAGFRTYKHYDPDIAAAYFLRVFAADEHVDAEGHAQPAGRTLYFVNVNFWNFSAPGTNAWSSNVRLYTEHGEFDLNYLIDGSWTVERLLERVKHAYETLDCVPDRHAGM